MVRLVSVSGGKDSAATLTLALESGVDDVRAAFCDTGNEHPLTYDYVRYLSQKTGIEIKWLKPDFTQWWWSRRDYVRDKWPLKGVDQTIINRVLSIMERGPTGNPYLDLCIIKGMFPSRRRQFCTQFLKTEPLTEHTIDLLDEFGVVESWQGVRAGESKSRASLPEYEQRGSGYVIRRPIHKWSVEMVFAQLRKHGVDPNPLYRLGMARVGCMPCINSRKDEILEISKRFPSTSTASRSGSQSSLSQAEGGTLVFSRRRMGIAAILWGATSARWLSGPKRSAAVGWWI